MLGLIIAFGGTETETTPEPEMERGCGLSVQFSISTVGLEPEPVYGEPWHSLLSPIVSNLVAVPLEFHLGWSSECR